MPLWPCCCVVSVKQASSNVATGLNEISLSSLFAIVACESLVLQLLKLKHYHIYITFNYENLITVYTSRKEQSNVFFSLLFQPTDSDDLY